MNDDPGELELDDELRRLIAIDPHFIEAQRRDFERLAREYQDDPDFLKALDEGQARFEARVVRVQGKAVS